MHMEVFLSGICMGMFWAAGVFFLKFWRTSRDPFFRLFAIACWLVALERVALLFVNGHYDSPAGSPGEVAIWVYLIRLCAFGLIIFAIIQKNRAPKSRAS